MSILVTTVLRQADDCEVFMGNVSVPACMARDGQSTVESYEQRRDIKPAVPGKSKPICTTGKHNDLFRFRFRFRFRLWV